MGDSRRHEVFGRFVFRQFPRAKSALVVADGKGELAAYLAKRYRVRVVEAKPRQAVLRKRVNYTRGWFSQYDDVPEDIIVGMHPDEDRSLVPSRLWRPELVVFDAVYNPRRTRLLGSAAEAGCRTVEGAEMFLGQAVVQFELWTGRDAPVEVMRAVVEQRL